MRVFNWLEAVRLIKQHNIKNAEAGLLQDRSWTSGVILSDGVPVIGEYTYLASDWATPVLVDVDTKIAYECHAGPESGYGPDTNWPNEVLAMLTDARVKPEVATKPRPGPKRLLLIPRTRSETP